MENLRYLFLIGAYGFFIVCPRMAAMTNIIGKNFEISIYWLTMLGTIFSIPLLIVMCWTTQKWGLLGGLIFAILTDLLSAMIISSVNIKASIQTFIIAIFVVAGNHFATWVTSKFL